VAEIIPDLDRAAASYWQNIANKAGPDKSAALAQASNLLRDARAEARIPDSARQPTLDDLETPPLDVVRRPRLSK
jgi:hypothetical protein